MPIQSLSSDKRLRRRRPCALLLGALSAVAAATSVGCSNNPPSGSTAYATGKLGNGDFLFECDDGLACLPFEGVAAKFPKQIASGSTFDIRFVAKAQEGSLSSSAPTYSGVTTSGLTPYLGDAPTGGLAAVKPGIGTLVARDSNHRVVDYTTISIVEPDSLIVYDSNFDASSSDQPTEIGDTLSIPNGESRTYRVVAAFAGAKLAGSLAVDWTSDKMNIIDVGYSDHVVTLHARSTGTATITADGAGTTKTITVEVK